KLAEAQTQTLTAAKDYKVSYSGNKKTGTGKYTITFLGNYKGSTAIKNQTFNIDKASFADLDVEVKAGDKVYSGKANTYKSAPYVLVDGVALKSSEYTVEYSYLDAAGQKVVIGKNKVELAEEENSKEITVTVTCKDKSNYSGTATGTYNVVRKGTDQTDISKAKITFKNKAGAKQSKVEYTGEEVYPDSIEIKIDKDTTVTLTSENWDADANISVEFVNNIVKGKASVIVSAKDGGSYVGSKTANFNVVAQSLMNRTDIWTNIAKIFGL
ncbi:MAG: hypothetical protein K2K10_05960, partial [Acetatifactor sp.]|nr:hypothetical protein [Acetatifactor sp.]